MDRLSRWSHSVHGSAQAVRQTADDLLLLARLARDAPRFLRSPLGVAEARVRVRRWLVTRQQRFLFVVERAIYGYPRSPYLQLLRHAGYELGDVQALVAHEGVEGALERLAADGVYVTFEELKGRRVAIRGGQRFAFRERDFDNPLFAPHFAVYTGGTRGRPSQVRRSLAFVDEIATSTAVGFDAHGVADPHLVFWLFIPTQWLLTFAKLGHPVVGWFYPLRPLPVRARLGARYLELLGRLGGHRFPPPRFCDLQQTDHLAHWLARGLGKRGQIVVLTTVSSATRIAISARAAGLSLEGVTFSGGGEPLTEGRRRHIEASGAGVFATYAANELTAAASGCATPAAADDVHFFDDRNAVIVRPRALPDGGPVVDAMHFSSVSPRGPKILLNADLGDYAWVERRDCGCALGQLGLRTHLSHIRSFEKLSGEGTTFARTNLEYILEEVLPARCGGSSMDYQLLEEEADDSATRLVLRVHPSIGALDEAAVRTALLTEIERGSVVDRYQARLLGRVGAVVISRQPPLPTRGGKILPFHLVARAEN